MVDAYDRLNEKLLKEKEQKFKEFVERAMADLGIYSVRIRFWKAYCPADTGQEIAHIHLDEEPPIICISLKTLKWLPMEGVENTAIHEVAHVRNPEHNSVLYLTIDSIMQKHWRPPSGVAVINGNAWIEKTKEIPKHKANKKECSYYPCEKKKGLKPCKLCKQAYCLKHREPKAPAMLSLVLYSPKDRILDESYHKEGGHPCIEYSDEYRTKKEKEERLKELGLWQRYYPKEEQEADEEYCEEVDSEEAKARLAETKEIERKKIKEYKEHLEEERKRERHEPPAVQPQHTREWASTEKEILKQKPGKHEPVKRDKSTVLNRFGSKKVIVPVILLVFLVAIAFLLSFILAPHIEATKGQMYKVTSESPLKVAARIEYTLRDEAKEVYLKNQSGKKVADLTCKKVGDCVEKPEFAIGAFKLVEEADSQYKYSIEKQTYTLCVEFENFLISPKCVPIEMPQFEFRRPSDEISIDASIFSCPPDYKNKNNLCVKIRRCSDGTEYDECNSNKPLYCEDGNLLPKASICGCSEEEEPIRDECISIYLKGQTEREFEYTVRGNTDDIIFTVYKGLSDYLAAKLRSYYPDDYPTDESLELRFLDEEHQIGEVGKLVELIRGKTEERDEQARIAISLVQNIPYDTIGVETDTLNNRYPYEVLYEKQGVCAEKSRLLALLLRELGFGAAVLEYEADNHLAVGIKCPDAYSLNLWKGSCSSVGINEISTLCPPPYISKPSGYCFIETTVPSIPTDDQGDYATSGKLVSVPKIIEISEGESFDSIEEEYNDAQKWVEINEMAEERGNVLPEFQYNIWRRLAYKYGIKAS